MYGGKKCGGVAEVCCTPAEDGWGRAETEFTRAFIAALAARVGRRGTDFKLFGDGVVKIAVIWAGNGTLRKGGNLTFSA